MEQIEQFEIHWEDAVAELRRALIFFDTVMASPMEERIAVGTDHVEWVESAARQVAMAQFPFDPV